MTESPVTRDGSPVEVYLNLEVEPEFTPVLTVLQPPGRVLDLGCGVGRLANVLAARGFEVTGVDDSPDMLTHLAPEVTGIEASLENLRLSTLFDHVIMASHLVNEADAATRSAFLRAATTHLAPGGRVYLGHYDAARMRGIDGGDGRSGRVVTRFDILGRDGDVFDGRATYRLGERSWTQEFTAELLDPDALRAVLAEAGLTVVDELSPTWTVARRADDA